MGLAGGDSALSSPPVSLGTTSLATSAGSSGVAPSLLGAVSASFPPEAGDVPVAPAFVGVDGAAAAGGRSAPGLTRPAAAPPGGTSGSSALASGSRTTEIWQHRQGTQWMHTPATAPSATTTTTTTSMPHGVGADHGRCPPPHTHTEASPTQHATHLNHIVAANKRPVHHLSVHALHQWPVDAVGRRPAVRRAARVESVHGACVWGTNTATTVPRGAHKHRHSQTPHTSLAVCLAREQGGRPGLGNVAECGRSGAIRGARYTNVNWLVWWHALLPVHTACCWDLAV